MVLPDNCTLPMSGSFFIRLGSYRADLAYVRISEPARFT